MSLSNKTVLVWDRGFYTALATKLGESAKKCFYFMPESSPYPGSALAQIGEGLPEIERIDDDQVWKCLDQADMVFFPDCYDGEFQVWLQSKGHRVFGGLGSERLEMDRTYFYDQLDKIGLPVAHIYRAEGLDDLESYLTGKGEKWLKRSYYRGDFDSKHFKGMRQIKPWINHLRSKLGMRSEDIEILVQNPILSSCEVGGDRFCVNGDFSPNPLVGYEVKDEAYVGKVFDIMPDIIENVDMKMAPLYKKLGYQGHYSNELRITDSGKVYFNDPTIRAPSPPSELMCEIYRDYPSDVWAISGGDLPECRPLAKYGVEIILISDWHKDHELCVTYPKELEKNVKLKNHFKKGGAYYCVPNKNEGFFGALVHWGDNFDTVVEEACEMVKEIEADGLDFKESVFDEARKQIEAGERWGVDFS